MLVGVVLMGMAVAVPPPSAASAFMRATCMGRLGGCAMEVAETGTLMILFLALSLRALQQSNRPLRSCTPPQASHQSP